MLSVEILKFVILLIFFIWITLLSCFEFYDYFMNFMNEFYYLINLVLNYIIKFQLKILIYYIHLKK